MRRTMLCLAMLAFAELAGCKFMSSSSEVASVEDEGTNPLPPPPTPAPTLDAAPMPREVWSGLHACDSVCENVPRNGTGLGLQADRERWAVCYSCRCKAGLGRLPSPEELKCSSATGPLERYRAVTRGKVVTGVKQIDPNGTDTSGCLNGGAAGAGCDLQSRFKRIVYDDKVEFQLLCRKPTIRDRGYYEYLIIGHNTENGATCFWQAQSGFDGESVPNLDLSDATNTANRTAYANTFYLYSMGPSSCAGCHSTDAFIWSPYLESAWPMRQAMNDPFVRARISPDAPYKLVAADTPNLTDLVNGTDLTAPGGPLADSCGSCHRVNTGSNCGFSMGSVANYRGGLDPASAHEHLRRYQGWMPPRAMPLAEAEQLRAEVAAACSTR